MYWDNYLRNHAIKRIKDVGSKLVKKKHTQCSVKLRSGTSPYQYGVLFTPFYVAALNYGILFMLYELLPDQLT